MNKSEMEYYLISELLKENIQGEITIPLDVYQRRQLLRGLFNVRPPLPVSEQFLAIQDEYLQLRQTEKNVTDVADLQPVYIDKQLYLWQGDITTLKVDAIVNAANNRMLGCFIPCHGCIDNAIHTFAGIQLRQACYELMQEQVHDESTGFAKITPAYNLPCQYVLHTVGPIVHGKLTTKHCDDLASCYRSCLLLAVEKGLESIAFCCISTGEFCFPKQEAAEIALNAVNNFLSYNTQLKRVIFNVFTDQDYLIYNNLLREVP